MAGSSKKRKGTSQAGGRTNPHEVMAAMSAFAKSGGRTSAEDLANALTEAYGGAQGLALLIKELTFAKSTQPSTVVKIVSSVMSFIERTEKRIGGQARLKMMSNEEVETSLCKLLAKHNFVVPIEGVTLHATQVEH